MDRHDREIAGWRVFAWFYLVIALIAIGILTERWK